MSVNNAELINGDSIALRANLGEGIFDLSSLKLHGPPGGHFIIELQVQYFGGVLVDNIQIYLKIKPCEIGDFITDIGQC